MALTEEEINILRLMIDEAKSRALVDIERSKMKVALDPHKRAHFDSHARLLEALK